MQYNGNFLIFLAYKIELIVLRHRSAPLSYRSYEEILIP